MSSGLITTPEGLEGEFRMMSLVFGVTNFATMSAVTRKPCDSSLCSSTQLPPA
jgi:hypothetical protein